MSWFMELLFHSTAVQRKDRRVHTHNGCQIYFYLASQGFHEAAYESMCLRRSGEYYNYLLMLITWSLLLEQIHCCGVRVQFSARCVISLWSGSETRIHSVVLCRNFFFFLCVSKSFFSWITHTHTHTAAAPGKLRSRLLCSCTWTLQWSPSGAEGQQLQPLRLLSARSF